MHLKKTHWLACHILAETSIHLGTLRPAATVLLHRVLAPRPRFMHTWSKPDWEQSFLLFLKRWKSRAWPVDMRWVGKWPVEQRCRRRINLNSGLMNKKIRVPVQHIFELPPGASLWLSPACFAHMTHRCCQLSGSADPNLLWSPFPSLTLSLPFHSQCWLFVLFWSVVLIRSPQSCKTAVALTFDRLLWPMTPTRWVAVKYAHNFTFFCQRRKLVRYYYYYYP